MKERKSVSNAACTESDGVHSARSGATEIRILHDT